MNLSEQQLNEWIDVAMGTMANDGWGWPGLDNALTAMKILRDKILAELLAQPEAKKWTDEQKDVLWAACERAIDKYPEALVLSEIRAVITGETT